MNIRLHGEAKRFENQQSDPKAAAQAVRVLNERLAPALASAKKIRDLRSELVNGISDSKMREAARLGGF